MVKSSEEVSKEPHKNGTWECINCKLKFKHVKVINNQFLCESCFNKIYK